MRLVLAALALLGCGERLAPQSRVDKPRILGIRADRPEAAPGDTINVDALWADPRGDGRDVGFLWFTCALGPGEDPRACMENLTPLLFSGVGPTHAYGAFEIPSDALENFDTAVQGVGLVFCAGGLPDLVEIAETGEIVCPEEEPVVSYKRIEVTRSETPNRNPDIEAVLFSGSPWSDRGAPPVDACPSGDCFGRELAITAEPGSAETFVGETPEGPAETEETLLVSFFATGGDFDRVRAIDPANTEFRVGWRAPEEAGDVSVWFVLRDGRGGIDWEARTITVTP